MEALVTYGKHFPLIAQHVATKSATQCRAFFAHNREVRPLSTSFCSVEAALKCQ